MRPLQPTDPKRMGPYTLKGVLGKGGMGKVYLGRDKNGNLAAVKVINATFADYEALRRRFRREIEAVRKVKGDFVAKILAASEPTDTTLWYASEYIAGVTLEEAVAARPLSGTALHKFTRWLFDALVELHKIGILHRDIKPSNIMLGQDGPRLIDFGIAYLKNEPTLTASGHIIGTPLYMAPEQLLGGKPQASWDVFAFGGVLVYAATGHTAFKEVTDILSVEPDTSDVPADIKPLVQYCLDKEWTKRQTFEGARQFVPYVVSTYVKGTALLSHPVLTLMSQRRSQLKQLPSNFSWAKALGVTCVVLVILTMVAAGVLWKVRPDVFEDIKQDIKEAIGKTSSNKAPTPTPSTPKTSDTDVAKPIIGSPPATTARLPQLNLALPKPQFTAGALGKSYIDNLPSSSITVKSAKASGLSLVITVEVSGYADHGNKPFAESCLAYAEGTSVGWLYPTKFSVQNTNAQGIREGWIEYNLLYSGAFRFVPECDRSKGTHAEVGKNSIKTLGKIYLDKKVITIVAAYKEAGSLKVVVPSYNDETTIYCLKNAGKLLEAELTQAVQDNYVFKVLLFKNAPSGAIYKCQKVNGALQIVSNGLSVS